MKSINLLVLSFVAICIACTPKTKQADQSQKETATLGSIEIKGDVLGEILSADAKIEILAQGFDWTEGPVWVGEGNFLLFSDIKPNTIYRWSEADSISVYLNPSGYTGESPRGGEVGSNGLILNSKGQLTLCQHGDRRIALMDAPLSDPKPNYVSLADNFEGKKFNSPNDLIIHSSGDIYFTDPPYGLEKQMNDPLKEIDFQGVYKWSAADSTVSLIADDITRPNGVALSPDERTLYVASSDPNLAVLHKFNLSEDGTVTDRGLLYDATSEVSKHPGLPDGMVVHPSGLIFATGPGGVWVFDEEGKVHGRIYTESATANCTFDDDFKTLYITADSYLLRVKMK